MSFYPPNDGARFVVAIAKKEDTRYPTVYKDFYESDNKAEADKMAQDVCKREGKDTIVFERGNTIIARYKCAAVDDAPKQEQESKSKKVKRK